jgi:hypothetical protein
MNSKQYPAQNYHKLQQALKSLYNALTKEQQKHVKEKGYNLKKNETELQNMYKYIVDEFGVILFDKNHKKYCRTVADQYLSFGQGILPNTKSHEELMATDPYYRELLKL